MKGTTNAQRNAVVGSSSAVDKLTLTLADGTTQQHTVSDMIPKDAEPTTGSAKFVTSGAVKASLDEKVDKVDGKQLSTEDYTNPEKNKLAGISAGAQVNVIEEIQLNGSKITPSSKAVNIDLSGYATKGDLSAIPKFAISVVSSLPTSDISTSTIYLLSNGGSSGNSYDEYLHVNGAWEKIGTTEVDLSGYVPKTTTVNNKQLNANITLTAGDVGALPADGTAVKATADANGNNIANTYATQTALTNGLAAKQNALTFDSAPTSGSSNPVTSGGVFSAINSKVDKTTQDAKDNAQDTSISGLSERVTALENAGSGIVIEEFNKINTDFISFTVDFTEEITFNSNISVGTTLSMHTLNQTQNSDTTEALYYDSEANCLKKCIEYSITLTSQSYFVCRYKCILNGDALTKVREYLNKALKGVTILYGSGSVPDSGAEMYFNVPGDCTLYARWETLNNGTIQNFDNAEILLYTQGAGTVTISGSQTLKWQSYSGTANGLCPVNKIKPTHYQKILDL